MINSGHGDKGHSSVLLTEPITEPDREEQLISGLEGKDHVMGAERPASDRSTLVLASSSCCTGPKVALPLPNTRPYCCAAVPPHGRSRAVLAASRGGHVVAARVEQVGGYIERGEESLRLPWRFEPTLNLLALSRGPSQALNTIVQSLVSSVIHVQPELPQGRAVAAQYARHDTAGLAPAVDQPRKTALRRTRTATRLHEDFEEFTVAGHCAP
mgnify:CR=1 FL=1